MSQRCLVLPSCSASPRARGAAGARAGTPAHADRLAPSADARRRGRRDASKVPLDEIRRYVSVYNAVKQAYVEPVDDKKLMHSAIRGLLFDLDPHSVYLDKDDAENFDEQSRGAYDGVGVELHAPARRHACA